MRSLAISIVAVTTLAAAAGAAEASPTNYEELGDGVAPQPFEHLVETACSIELELRGAIATGVTRQQIVNRDDHDAGPPLTLLASWELALPAHAVVTAMSVREDRGAWRSALSVPANANTDAVADPELLGTDPALLTATATGAQIQLRQLAPGHRVEVTTTWSVVAELVDGSVRVGLRGRPAAPRTASCAVHVHASAGPGVTVSGLLRDGHAIPRATADRGSFTLDDQPTTISALLAFARAAPVVWTQTEALGGGWTAELTTVLAPARGPAATANRALLVIDRSRSMTVIGAHAVTQVVHAIGAALPPGTELEAIVYDRTASRVLGDWQPVSAARLATIEAAISAHANVNGSELADALALAHEAIGSGSAGDNTMVIAITDGILPTNSADAMLHALAGTGGPATLPDGSAVNAAHIDVHAIVLDPGATTGDGVDDLRALVIAYGGTYVELPASTLDTAVAYAEDWLHPAWNEVTADPALHLPPQLLAGTGVVRAEIHRGAAITRYTVGVRDRAPSRLASESAPTIAGAIAGLALVATTDREFLVAASSDADVSALDLERAGAARAAVMRHHPIVDDDHALAVLADTGTIARQRITMVEAGGPFVSNDSGHASMRGRRAAMPTVQVGRVTAPGVALPREMLSRMFRYELQPAAYACYQAALGVNPGLAGTINITLEIARGEITRATATTLGDAAFDRCVIDAAYALQPTLPDPDAADQGVVVRYPLTFVRHQDTSIIVLGDADSSSPIDIDAITRSHIYGPALPGIKVNAAVPLGGIPRP